METERSTGHQQLVSPSPELQPENCPTSNPPSPRSAEYMEKSPRESDVQTSCVQVRYDDIPAKPLNNKNRKGRGKRGCDYSLKTNNSDSNIWTIYQLNIRGFNSKKSLLEAILKSFEHVPDLLVISETHLQFEKKLVIPGFDSYTRNRKSKSHGGIATSIKSSESYECLKVSEGKYNDEYIVSCHKTQPVSETNKCY